MPATHLEFLVEEPSMEAFLQEWVGRHLPEEVSFRIVVFNGKRDLLGKLPSRLVGYRGWMPADWKLVVIVDRDNDSCKELKAQLETKCQNAGFSTRLGGPDWEAVTRIAIEELEAWYFGDWDAVTAAYPGVPKSIVSQTRYRHSDAINGGTWEAFERVLQSKGYFRGGLQKVSAAREIGAHVDAERSTSESFKQLAAAIDEAVV